MLRERLQRANGCNIHGNKPRKGELMADTHQYNGYTFFIEKQPGSVSTYRLMRIVKDHTGSPKEHAAVDVTPIIVGGEEDVIKHTKEYIDSIPR